MKSPEKALEFQFYRRWWISFPFILALIVLAFMIGTTFRALTDPDDGISTLHPSGVVGEIDSSGPTFNKLQEGDLILSVDGNTLTELSSLYTNKKSGDEVHLVIERSGDRVPVTFRLIDPSIDTILKRVAPLFVALVFWGVGISIQAFLPNEKSTNVFFLFCLGSSMLLSTGLISSGGPPWTSAVFNFLLWLIGPLAVHFHLHFPQATSMRVRRLILGGLYGIGILGGLPYLIWGLPAIRALPWFQQILSSSRFFLAINILLVVGLLIHTYRYATTAGARGKIRIVVLGGGLSALPLVSLTILPDALFQQPIIPYAYAFLLLAVLPLTYGYAIFRHQLIEIERHVNRGATYILVYSLLAGVYLVLNAFLSRLLPDNAAINAILVLALATIFIPVQKSVQKIVDTAFYGGWYDYRSAVTQITQGLGGTRDLRSLAESISERLVKTLRLEDVVVFLKDLDGNFSVIDVAPKDKIGSAHPILTALPQNSIDYLLNIGDVERASLEEALSEVSLSPEEHQLLNSEQAHLWVPILGHGQTLGLFALGPKFGGDIFSSEDLDILRVVARQVGPLIENVHLLNRLRRYASDLERRVEDRTAELHAAKERVEAILASVGDGVVVTDLDSRIITVNSALEAQSGYLSTEIIGKRLQFLINNHSDQDIFAEMRQTLLHGDVWSGELINRCKDGTLYDSQLTMAPVRDQSGQVVGYVGSQRDITHQKELDRLKDQFVSDVSHELRTPVTNIGLYLELLENVGSEKQDEYIQILHGEVNQLRRLIEDVLDISRLDVSKDRELTFMRMDLNLVVEQTVVAHQPLAESSGLELTFDPDPDLPAIRGEPNQLARVVSNLLSNAIRYTSSGWIRVSTYWANEKFQESNKQSACIQVEDSGMGISHDDLHHIFERFYRGRDVAQAKFPGTGLGLAIAKEIIDMHSGFIEVESQMEKGSCFRIWLPV